MDFVLGLLKNFFGTGKDYPVSMNTIIKERIAIDQSATLGSLYDISSDTFVGKLRGKFKSDKLTTQEHAKCYVCKGRTAETQNLLKMIGMDLHQRISILSKMIEPNGAACVINHPRLIDEHTRFLYFRFEMKTKSCQNDLLKKVEARQVEKVDTYTIHVLGQITYGMHGVVVFQIQPDQQEKIDSLFEKLRYKLLVDSIEFEIESERYEILKTIHPVAVYSNVAKLNNMPTLYDICKNIKQIKTNSKNHSPIKHTLLLIEGLTPSSNNIRIPVNEEEMRKLENTLLEQFNEVRTLQIRLDHELPELLQDKLQERLNAVKEGFTEIRKLYDNYLKNINDQIKLLRAGQNAWADLNQIMGSEEAITIKDSLQRLQDVLDHLKSKGKLINKLQTDGFEYCNVEILGINRNDTQEKVTDTLLNNNLNKVIICCNDELNRKLSSKLSKGKQKYPQHSLIYADFSYAKWPLQEIMVLPPRDQSITENNITSKKLQAPLAPDKSNDQRIITILLIGESGVGKSTFINAFANYLQFNSLADAQNGQPTVIIPVSFLMTTNDTFDEHIVKFGEPDPNENHMNIGQSVTQQCRSYVFPISSIAHLRIIDTPGFSDTRGSDQDEHNMKMIFSYLNNISYVHGICLLFKPNVQQLHPYWYACFTQLFQYFGENIREHLMFCFTNCRSTFYAPGDTRPALVSLLKSLPVNNIPCEKANTFCFDSESFRYLVALQQKLTFEEIQREEFEKSWKKSVEESNRFKTFLCDQLKSYDRSIEWKSIRDARSQIIPMIRPILEGMRNIIRNILLSQMNCSIILKAIHLDQIKTISYPHDRSLERCGDFWIFSDHLTSILSTNEDDNQTEYRLNYEFKQNKVDETVHNLQKQLKELIKISAIFGHFLMTTKAKEQDSFLLGFTRMIQEEEIIYQKYPQSTENRQLMEELEKLRNEYQLLLQETNSNGDISTVYEQLESLNEIQMVKVQIDAIKMYREHFVRSNERDPDIQTTPL